MSIDEDHCMSAIDLVKIGIPCYMSESTRKNLDLDLIEVNQVTAGDQFKIGTFTIKTFPVFHDVPNMGFLIKSDLGGKMVFITDCGYCNNRFDDLEIIAIECNYDQDRLFENIEAGDINRGRAVRTIQTHLSLENVIIFLKDTDLSKCREIHLLHLSKENANKKAFIKTIQALTGLPVYCL